MVQQNESTTPVADAELHVRRANASKRDGRVSDAVDCYCRAATSYEGCGMLGRARGALTIAWRLVVDAADEHPARIASVASELSRIQYENGFAIEAEDVVRTAVDKLAQTGHLRLVMHLAEWTVETAQKDARLGGLSVYVLRRMGFGLTKQALTPDARNTLVDVSLPTDDADPRDTLVDYAEAMARASA